MSETPEQMDDLEPAVAECIESFKAQALRTLRETAPAERPTLAGEITQVVQELRDRFGVAENLLVHKLCRHVSELGFSKRVRNVLWNCRIDYIGDLVLSTEKSLITTKNFGRKSLKEVKDLLSPLGLSLGMKISERGRTRFEQWRSEQPTERPIP